MYLKSNIVVIFLFLFTFIAIVNSYKILVVFPTPSRSHTTLGKGFVRALLDDGHEVIFATAFPDKNPVKNLRYIDVSALSDVFIRLNLFDEELRNPDPFYIKREVLNLTKTTLMLPEMQKVLKTENVDAVVSEFFFCHLEAGIAAVLQAPWIVFGGVTMHPGLEYLVDAIQSPAVVPLIGNDFEVPMSLIDRIKNTLMVTAMTLHTLLFELPETEVAYKEIFEPIAEARGVQLPSLYDAIHDISALFLNSHPSMAHAQTLPPNVFEIGGYHMDPKISPLPEDLKAILDNSSQGFIYFSMGSVLKSSYLPQKTKEDLLNIFRDLPYTVLWKFEEELENIPKNVIIRPWMPQASILAHPNLKLFITHGGLLSLYEAIHHGIPVLAIPVFADQPSNAALAARKGYALNIPYSPDMGPELKEKLLKMLTDDRYYKKAKEMSHIFNARAVPNADLITHQIKLAIETNGAHHLRSTSLQYRWYHRLLIDQILVLLFIITTLYYIIRRLCCTSRTHEKKKQKKN